jgi:hypothetical protein
MPAEKCIMTAKIFWKDPYQTHLETGGTSVNDDVITLKETILFLCIVWRSGK